MTILKLLPGKKERLGDQLYGQILEQIVSGSLKEGAKLPSERTICQSFQVSRPVVREALTRLQADGLVVSRQGAGTFVEKRPPSELVRFADSADVAGLLRCCEVRMSIEGHAAALAARRHTPQQLSDIIKALDHMRVSFAAGTLPIAADFNFHVAVAKASGNDLFASVLEMLHPTIERSMAVGLRITREISKERIERVLGEHQEICNAIARGDSDAADLAMRYHIDRSRQRVTDNQRDT